ncbi:cysteine desulfurase DndA [Streptomyces griseus]|uniref:cysteine desulfurase DndA n=1 Tax=Streptomyces globisporus TaxID=1908 RepID=UPI0005CA6E64|nr:cysteine desulfurase DndA [Streptomyces globisporus]PPA44459.1 cysteine desulfurase DndA [Streptomyces griseus]RAN21678.1 cysteine desulfurase DndA [Streptomyces badius]RAN29613.1 cysteine desulfurase DndA [Streptomyces badius]
MVAYLDVAATTRVDPQVADVVLHWMTEDFGNAGSRTHEFGTRAKKAVQEARSFLASTVGAKTEEVIFTSGATESNNIALLGIAPHGEQTGRKHIITSAIEHKAVIEPLLHLQEIRGFEVDFLEPGPSGRVSTEAVLKKLRPDTLLVSLMHVNNETGVIQPVAELAEELRGTSTYFHVDAAQGYGKVPQDLTAPIDLISISGHKVGAPKGVGALVTRRRGWDKVPLSPIMFGGGQERKLRPGTLPVALVMGLYEAARLFGENRYRWEREAREMRERMLTALAKTRFRVNGDTDHSVPHILNVTFDGLNAEALIVRLKEQVAIATGSACTSASYTPSHVLTAMGLPAEVASNGLRFSWFPAQVDGFDPQGLAETIAHMQPNAASGR